MSFIVTVTERELKEGEREHLRGTQPTAVSEPSQPTPVSFIVIEREREREREREGEEREGKRRISVQL
jgi:hypothetical protein